MTTRPDLTADDLFGVFAEMRIKHPLHEDAVKIFETLRKRKVSAPKAEQNAVSLFAGSRSGKTTTVKWYIESVIVDEWQKERRKRSSLSRETLTGSQTLALHVELSGETTMSGLMSDFLLALGDADPYGGGVKQRKYRVEKALERLGYQIIFLDETQHLKSQGHSGPVSRRSDANEVQNTLKNWVKRWPMVFVGTQHAERVVFEHQVDTRSEMPIKFGPLHFSIDRDKVLTEAFLGRLALKIHELGILDHRPEILVTGDVPLCFNIATKGRLAMSTILVRMALEHMMSLGKRSLTRDYLAKAVDDYALRIGVCSYNPFTIGPTTIPSIEDYLHDTSELGI